VEPVVRLFCAIDVMDGEVVRLKQGEAAARKAYRSDPVAQARDFIAAGATTIHVVDLDAAFGKGENRAVIAAIAALSGCDVQTGGGLRTLPDVEAALDAGVWRVVIGSAAVENPQLVSDVIKRFGPCLAVGLDARDGTLRTRGWTLRTELTVIEVGRQMAERGVETLIYTDIARDGMLEEPDIDGSVELARATGCGVVVSGGVSKLADLKAVAERGAKAGLEGVIVGRALYEQRIEVPKALSIIENGKVL
jgi:phosphoribosylformimino-5-aminoimidazole carboxamide ribotide isomerase